MDMFAPFFPLGCLLAYAKVYQEGRLRDAFEFGSITPIESRFTSPVLDALPAEPGIFLIPDYVWNHGVNVPFAREVRRRWPSALIIAGGPNIPRNEKYCRRFLAENPEIDVTVRHEGEITLSEILAKIAESRVGPEGLQSVDLSGVPGLTFRREGDLVRTPDRGRNLELGAFPSPYLTGEFDHWLDDRLQISIETTRGCPYGCSFCDWGAATLSKVARMTMERVLGEIEFAGQKRVKMLAFCDANFGILPRDVDIARHIVATKERYGFPRHVGYSNAKTATPRLTEVIKTLYDSGMIQAAQISVQTTDAQVLENVQRSNIKTDEYRKLIAFFHREGMPVSSDAMLGLPGQTYETCKSDLQFFFDHRVNPILFATYAMPNAPLGSDEYRERFRIAVGSDGLVESTYSFTREDYAKMFELCLAYKLFIKLDVLKFLLYFLQLERGLPALDLMSAWLSKAAEDPERYPISHRMKKAILAREYKGLQKDWFLLSWSAEDGENFLGALDAFHAEILGFAHDEFGLEPDGDDLKAVLIASREVMPGPGRKFPARIPLPHDVPAYFAALRAAASLEKPPPGFRPLKEYPEGFLELADQPCASTYQHADFWVGNDSIALVGNLKL